MHCHCGTNNRAPRWTFTENVTSMCKINIKNIFSIDVNKMMPVFDKYIVQLVKMNLKCDEIDPILFILCKKMITMNQKTWLITQFCCYIS